MKLGTWKVLAIIFMCLFLLETIFISWAVYDFYQEEEKTYDCLYNFCAEYYDAYYELGICSCYDLDLMGDYVLGDTKYYN